MKHLINSLAVFRATYFILYDVAPFELMAKLRDALGVRQNAYGNTYGTNELAKALSCYWCASLWLGLLFAKGNIREALAYSGVTALLFRLLDTVA